MSVSVVLPAYVPTEGLRRLTITCLESLEATAGHPYELVVVDNGSSPDGSSLLREKADIYLRYDKPIGYAPAVNRGIVAAHYDWLLVLNTDIEFQELGWLPRMVADYALSPGGILSAEDEGRQGIIYDQSWFSCWLTHRDVIEKVGYFDEALPFRFHDQDYAIRIHRAGLRVMRTGSCPVSHVEKATYSLLSPVDDPVEAQLMRERWGAVNFAEWLALAA